jgi:hypothetical protein
MTNRIPHVTEDGGSKYTIIRDYDHIIAALDVLIDNLEMAKSFVDPANSSSPEHLSEMSDYHNQNLFNIMQMKYRYLQDRDQLSSELNKNTLYHD